MAYGDIDNVKSDVRTLNDIMSRQGTELILDVIAEHVGTTVNKFKLDEVEASRIRDSLLDHLKEAVNERI